jgi:hypothetical protein
MRNPRTRIVLMSWVMFAATSSAVVTAQPQPEWRGEVFVSAGGSGFSRFEDRGFGRHSDFGVGAALRVSPRFAVQAEVDRVYGLPAGSSGCVVGDPCAATVASVAALWLFSTARVQPYVMGGMLILRSQTDEIGPLSVTERSRVSDTGFGPLVGGGAKIFITDRLYVQPSIFAGSTVRLSRMNLSMSRASIAVGYRW